MSRKRSQKKAEIPTKDETAGLLADWKKLDRARKRREESADFKEFKNRKKFFDDQDRQEKELRKKIADYVRDKGRKVRGQNRWIGIINGEEVTASIDSVEMPAYSYEKKNIEITG